MTVPRAAESLLYELKQGYPVIGITGPRQSGKTTLAQRVFSDKPYVSLENPDVRDRAESDPRSFLETYQDGAVFDEVQRCPVLFSYLQEIVDTDPFPGRYVLTGSQQFGLWSNVSQSLAGRIGLVHLLPFTYHEWYSGESATPDLNEVLYNGLYPPVHDRNLRPYLWYANYVQTYIERDVRQMINVRDLSGFQRFVRLCAGRSGQLVNLSGLASDCGITHNTAAAWISILEASYLLFRLQPHHRNFNKRLIKTPKLYFYDTGLAAWLLGIQNTQQLDVHPMRGALFEGYVISEWIKSRYNQGRPASAYFWRDRGGHEVDMLIEHAIGLQPVEIKSGKTLAGDAFDGLRKWLTLAGDQAHEPAVIYGGSETGAYNGIQIYPWYDTAWHP